MIRRIADSTNTKREFTNKIRRRSDTLRKDHRSKLKGDADARTIVGNYSQSKSTRES